MTTDLTTAHRIRMQRRVDRRLDALYAEASALGKTMGKVFAQRNRSQLRNLAAVVASATRTSTLKNHVKNQTGKNRGRRSEPTWTAENPSIGQQALTLLDKLGGQARDIVAETAAEPTVEMTEDSRRELARTVELDLQRGVVHTLVCAAEYSHVEIDE
ncbi:MAG: hypothetical protein MJE77_44020 [Proteobacteria bacterium]|nr:hypothetical protein [Pseudomonadota bacterium]